MGKVIVYSKENCGQCIGVKRFLKNKGVEFEERNTSLNHEWLKEVMELQATGFPVVVTDSGESVQGFAPDKLRALLGM